MYLLKTKLQNTHTLSALVLPVGIRHTADGIFFPKP